MREQIKLVLLFIVLFSSLYSNKFVFAESNVQQAYTSNGEIGFYGKYEYPKEVAPPIGSKPENPFKPLPQTGEKKQGIITMIGSILALGGFLGIRRVKELKNLSLEENKK